MLEAEVVVLDEVWPFEGRVIVAGPCRSAQEASDPAHGPVPAPNPQSGGLVPILAPGKPERGLQRQAGASRAGGRRRPGELAAWLGDGVYCDGAVVAD
jgi:hypothetical protein